MGIVIKNSQPKYENVIVASVRHNTNIDIAVFSGDEEFLVDNFTNRLDSSVRKISVML